MIAKLPDIVTPEQAAEWLQVSRETVYRYIRDGRLVASQIGRTYRIRRENLDRFVDDTSTRSNFQYRIYSDDEIARFLQEDALSPESQRIADAFQSAIAAADAKD
jgi:excisionase family DNA binding protein